MSEPFGQIERRTVADEIRHAIAEGIRNGRLRAGEVLPPERELAEQFGVARTSVREAIVGLSALGVIERTGNRVRVVEHLPSVDVDVDHRKTAVRDMFETRRAIEVAVAEFACCRADDAQRSELAEMAGGFRSGLDIAEFRRLDRAFHAAIADACGNRVLAEVYSKVLDALFHSGEFESLLTDDVNAEAVAEIIDESARAHEAIATAMAEGSVTGVAAAVTAHLDQVESRMIEKLV
ncbi:MAG: FCD domain-containing protein [Acidimicrobiales bacterium]